MTGPLKELLEAARERAYCYRVRTYCFGTDTQEIQGTTRTPAFCRSIEEHVSCLILGLQYPCGGCRLAAAIKKVEAFEKCPRVHRALKGEDTEVTPAMIEAGRKVLDYYQTEYDWHEECWPEADVVAGIFTAMLEIS